MNRNSEIQLMINSLINNTIVQLVHTMNTSIIQETAQFSQNNIVDRIFLIIQFNHLKMSPMFQFNHLINRMFLTKPIYQPIE